MSTTFQLDRESRAFLSIEVTPQKIEHLAWELFAARLENEAGIRYACFGGSKIVPTHHFGLQNCRISAIPCIFGADVANAIYANPTYQEERLGQDDRTSCVGMVVHMKADSCAKIYISLHLREGSQLKDTLFPTS